MVEPLRGIPIGPDALSNSPGSKTMLVSSWPCKTCDSRATKQGEAKLLESLILHPTMWISEYENLSFTLVSTASLGSSAWLQVRFREGSTASTLQRAASMQTFLEKASTRVENVVPTTALQELFFAQDGGAQHRGAHGEPMVWVDLVSPRPYRSTVGVCSGFPHGHS